MKTKELFGIFTITIVLLTQARAQVPFTNSLAAYFPFNGNANDASGNGNNGTLFGAARFGVDRFGKRNACLSLPGTRGIDSGVDIPSLSSMSYTPVTYSAWFLLNDYPLLISDNAVMTLVGREKCGEQFQGALCIYTGSTVIKELAYYWGQNGIYTETVPPTNQWCQVVLTIDQAGNAEFYFNGTKVFAAAGGGVDKSVPSGAPLDFRIGASTSGWCGGESRYVWDGLIDDVRIYSRALSASEVQQLYAYESVPGSITAQLPPVLITRPQIVSFLVGFLTGLITGLLTGLLLGYCIHWLKSKRDAKNRLESAGVP